MQAGCRGKQPVSMPGLWDYDETIPVDTGSWDVPDHDDAAPRGRKGGRPPKQQPASKKQKTLSNDLDLGLKADLQKVEVCLLDSDDEVQEVPAKPTTTTAAAVPAPAPAPVAKGPHHLVALDPSPATKAKYKELEQLMTGKLDEDSDSAQKQPRPATARRSRLVASRPPPPPLRPQAEPVEDDDEDLPPLAVPTQGSSAAAATGDASKVVIKCKYKHGAHEQCIQVGLRRTQPFSQLVKAFEAAARKKGHMLVTQSVSKLLFDGEKLDLSSTPEGQAAQGEGFDEDEETETLEVYFK